MNAVLNDRGLRPQNETDVEVPKIIGVVGHGHESPALCTGQYALGEELSQIAHPPGANASGLTMVYLAGKLLP